MYRPSQTPRLTLSSKRIIGLFSLAKPIAGRPSDFNSIIKLRLTEWKRRYTISVKTRALSTRDLLALTQVREQLSSSGEHGIIEPPQHSPFNRVSKETMKVEVFHRRLQIRKLTISLLFYTPHVSSQCQIRVKLNRVFFPRWFCQARSLGCGFAR